MLAIFHSKRNIRFSDSSESVHVHFDVYIRLMEETEYAFLRSRGLGVVLEDGKGIIGFPRLHAELQVTNPLVFGDLAETTLRLSDENGKSISYEFEIHHRGQLSATGRFEVACCRFPPGDNPYAILIPEFVSQKLRSEPVQSI